jgi:hypothetical protein
MLSRVGPCHATPFYCLIAPIITHVSLHPRPCTQIGNVVLPPSLQRTHYCTALLHRAFTR